MKKFREVWVVAVALVTVFFGGLSSSVFAANANGYRVSPVRTELILEPGGTKSFPVYVQNISGATENLQVVVNDFEAGADESGQPALLLNGKDAPRHGLRRYVTVPTSTITLKPNEQKSVTIQVAIPKNVPGGGYFGAIRFAPAGDTSEKGKNVNLAASVASLVLVKVPGQITEQLSIASFDVRQGDSPRILFTSNKNLKAVVRFQNSGNVQEQPFGKIQLKKGKQVLATTDINTTDPRGNVLPDSIRRFSVDLNKVGKFGKYTIEGNFGYGTTGQLLSAKTTFYVIPVYLLVLVLLLLALILFLIFGLPRLIRNYNRHILARAGRR
jgi:hypothetical protein